MRRAANLVLAALLAGCAAAPAPAPRAAGALAARAEAQAGFFDLAGKPASLAALAGRAVVVSFLAPGDGDSEAQLPLLLRLEGAYGPAGVAFVVAGERAAAAGLGAWAGAHGIGFAVWEDRGGAELRARGFARVPAHEFRAASGAVAHAREGFMSRGELTAQLEAIKP